MCAGANVLETMPGASSMPPPIAASKPCDEVHLPVLEPEVGADARIALQETGQHR
jgi:hypothetical protein